MKERKGWIILYIGVLIFLAAFVGVVAVAFLWGATFMEGILR